MAKKKRKKGATRPPYGSYDPALDQSERSADRGLGDLIADVTRANTRSGQDYGLGQEDINRQFGRSHDDLLLDRSRGTEDYQASIANLVRNYQRLGNSQRQSFAASGNLGGASIQAAQKRASNQAIDRQPLDTNYNRFLADSTTAETRLGENKNLGLGQLGLNYARDYEDRNVVQLPRAQRENEFFKQDLNETRVDQAKMAGLLPEDAPRRKRKRVTLGRYRPTGVGPGAGRLY